MSNQYMSDDENEQFEEEEEKRIKGKGLLPAPSLPTFREVRKAANKKNMSFLELIQEVRIADKVNHNTNKYHSHELERDIDDQTTLAYDILIKWSEGDLTEHYMNFFRQMSRFVKTLPLAVHFNSKGKLLKVIEKHMKVEGQTAYEGIFDVITALAKDLRGEFYPNLPAIFDLVVNLLDPRDTERNSLVFTTLAFLFKYLSKYMVNDLADWFKRYSKLIGNNKWYIRKFAAESFAFLINKLSDKQLPEYIDKTFDLLSKKPTQDMFDGTSQLFFETMKSVYGSFHSRMSITMHLLFRKLDWIEDETVSISHKREELQRRFTLMQKCTQLLVEHSRSKEVVSQLWNIYTKELEFLISKWFVAQSSHDSTSTNNNNNNNNNNIQTTAIGTQIGHVVGLMTSFISREKSVVEYMQKTLDLIVDKKLLQSKLPELTLGSILTFAQTAITVHQKHIFQKIPGIFFNILSLSRSELLFSFFRDIMKVLYDSDSDNGGDSEQAEFFKRILQYVADAFDDNQEEGLAFLVNFIESVGKEKAESISLRSDQLLRKVIGALVRECQHMDKNSTLLLESVSVHSNEEVPFNITRIWASLKCLSSFFVSEDLFEETKLFKHLSNLFNTLQQALIKRDEVKAEVVAVAANTLHTLSVLSKHSIDSFKVMHNLLAPVLQLLCRQGSHLHILRAVDYYLSSYSKGEPLSNKFFLAIWEPLQPNLHSRFSEVRLFTLRILTQFEQTPLIPSNISGQYNGPCDVLNMLRESEETGIDWELSRKKIYDLERALQHIQRYRERVPDHIFSLLSHYALGGLFIKFSIAWPPCNEIAKALLTMKFKLFWDIFYPIFVAMYIEASEKVVDGNQKIFIHKKEHYLKMPFVKFQNYEKAFKIRSLTALETIFSSEFNSNSDHTDLTTYMNMLWELFDESGAASGSRPNDVCDFFSRFYHRELEAYEDKNLIVLLPNSKLSTNLKILLGHLSRLSSEFLEDEANVDTCTKMLSLVQKLLSTSNSEIQHLTIDCLQKFNLPWLQPYMESIHKLINVRQSTSVLSQLPLNHRRIQQAHRANLLPLIIQILEPSLMKYDMKKAKRGKVTAQQSKWQSRVNEVVKYFGVLRKDELKLFMTKIFQRLLVVKEDASQEFGIDFIATFNATNASKIKHLLCFFKAIFVAQENYVKFYDSILSILVQIIQVCVGYETTLSTQEQSSESKMDEDDEIEGRKISRVHAKTDKSKRQLKEAEAEVIDMVIEFFDLHPQYSYEFRTLDRLMLLFNYEFSHYVEKVPSFHKLLQIHFTWFKHSAMNYLVYHYGIAERIINLLTLELQPDDFSTILDLISHLLSHKNTQFGSNAPKEILNKLQQQTIGAVLLKPHTDRIMTYLFNILSRSEEMRKNFQNKCFGAVDRLSDYFTDESPAEIILYFYGRTFNNNRVADSHAEKVLDLFSRYLPRAVIETRSKYIKIFANLFITQTNESYRKSMCDIIKKTDKSMEYTADIIYGLNCYTATRLDKIDYSVRIDTFTRIIQGEGQMSKLSELQLYPIATNLLYYLNDEQWNIRDNAAKALRSLIRAIAKHSSDSSADELKQLIVSHVKGGATSEKVLDLNEYLPILAEFVVFEEFAEIKPLHKFLLLLSESALEKKQKALKLFSSVVLPGEGKKLTDEISQATLYSLFVPMLIHLLWSTDMALSKQAQKIVIQMTPQLSWEFGEKMMNNFMNMISLTNKSKKALKRRTMALAIICDLLEAYPFEKLKQDSTVEQEVTLEDDEEDVEMKEAADVVKQKGLTEPEKIRNYFIRVIIPMLQENLWDKKEDISVMKLNIAFLVIKILKRCSKELLRRELSKIILSLIGKLKSKKEEQQRECQRALLDILQELGSQYFHFTLQKLVDALKSGYEIDVLYMTLFTMLKTLKNRMKNVKIDGAVDLVLEVLLHDITLPPSLVNNKKKGHKFETEQDTKDDAGFQVHNQSILFSSFEILCQVMNFEQSIDTVITRVDDILKTVHSSSVLKRFEGVFEKILAGLSKNTSITEPKLVEFASKKIAEKGLYQKKFDMTKRDAFNKYHVNKAFMSKPEEYYLVQKEPGRQGAIESNLDARLHQLGEASNDHYIVQFAVTLIDNGVKLQHIKNIKSLDSLVPRLIKYVSGKHMKLALVSLHVLISMQKHKDSLANQKRQEILDAILNLMLNTGVDTANETWDTLFTAIKFFLDDSNKKDGAKLSEKQLDVLLDMLKIDITNSKELNVKPFQLLHTLVEKKVTTPHIYDLMDKVRNIMIKVVDQSVQTQCIQMLTKFYLNYPFTPEVLQEHLNFLFKNVINDHMPFEGKLALIRMIHTIIEQFPAELLNEKVEFIFCPLILQLSNERQANSVTDTETKADKLIEDALYAFMRRISEESFQEKVVTMICKWIKSSKLRPVAVHACSIAARVANGGRLKNSGVLDSDILPVLKSHIENMSAKESSKRSKILLLKNCVQTLSSLFDHGIITYATIEPVWQHLLNIIKNTESHMVRTCCLDMITLFLSRSKSNKNCKIVTDMRQMNNLLDTCYELLKRNDLHMVTDADTFSASVIKCVLFTIETMFYLTNSKLSSEDKAANILQNFFLKIQVLSVKTPDSGERNASLVLQKLILLKLFVALSKKFNVLMNNYLVYMTPLLYRSTEDTSSSINKKIINQQVVDLAKKVKEEIKNLFNYELFMKSYEEGKQRVDGQSKSSKEKSDRKAVIDPVQFAKKKLNTGKKRAREEDGGAATDGHKQKKRKNKH